MPPDIDEDKTSNDVTVSEGSNTTLICAAHGLPLPQVQGSRKKRKSLLMAAQLMPYPLPLELPSGEKKKKFLMAGFLPPSSWHSIKKKEFLFVKVLIALPLKKKRFFFGKKKSTLRRRASRGEGASPPKKILEIPLTKNVMESYKAESLMHSQTFYEWAGGARDKFGHQIHMNAKYVLYRYYTRELFTYFFGSVFCIISIFKFRYVWSPCNIHQ